MYVIEGGKRTRSTRSEHQVAQEVENKTKTERHIRVENEEAGRKVHGWRKEVKMDVKLHAHSNIFIDMMTEFKSM